jgi:hypothetical protein
MMPVDPRDAAAGITVFVIDEVTVYAVMVITGKKGNAPPTTFCPV